MQVGARFVHTNIVAGDWKRLAQFYEQVFGCEMVPPERKLEGQWLDDGTGVGGAQIQGIHVLLPGHGTQGPTLEILQCKPHEERPEVAINRLGLAHIAFAVEDIVMARDAVLAAGGGIVGEMVSVPISGAGTVTFVYVTDPEGNIIGLVQG